MERNHCIFAITLIRTSLMETNTVQSTQTVPVALTERAAAEVKSIMTNKNIGPEYALRLGVKGGGCSGMSYLLGFDTRKETDEQFEINGVPVLVDKRHSMYILGMEVDFEDGLNARGFVFNNPQASSTCGCGSSFSA
jgi:iron-sulfur cluster assembly protein